MPYNILQKIKGDVMLTITTAGKSVNDALTIVKNAASGSEAMKILVDGPVQADTLKKFLDAQGYSVLIEDDEGTLYLTAKKQEAAVQVPAKISVRPVVSVPQEARSTIGVIISCRNKEYNSSFMKKFLLSLFKAERKPDVIALLDSAVKIAAYNSPLCVTLKKLETEGVQILISESCADRLGITDAAGAGVIVDMSEILDEIFSCSKIVSI